MPKFRLLNRHRLALGKFARRSLVCEPESAAETAAHGRLMAVVDAMIATMAPESDMVVLRRHKGVATVDSFQLRIPTDAGSYRQVDICFCPRDPAEGRFRHRPRGGCHTPSSGGRVTRSMPAWMAGISLYPHMHTNELLPAIAADLVAAYDAYAKAAHDHDDARDEVLKAVDCAIDNSYYLEALIEVWPMAEQMREALGAKLLPTVAAPSEFAQTIAAATFVKPAASAP